MSMILAVDIGGTKIAAALVSNGQIRAREQISTPSSSSPEAMTAALSACYPHLRRRRMRWRWPQPALSITGS